MVRMPTWVTGEGPRPYRPWVVLWLAVNDDKVHMAGMGKPGEEDPGLLWEGLVEMATDDTIGGYRPRFSVRARSDQDMMQETFANQPRPCRWCRDPSWIRHGLTAASRRLLKIPAGPEYVVALVSSALKRFEQLQHQRVIH